MGMVREVSNRVTDVFRKKISVVPKTDPGHIDKIALCTLMRPDAMGTIRTVIPEAEVNDPGRFQPMLDGFANHYTIGDLLLQSNMKGLYLEILGEACKEEKVLDEPFHPAALGNILSGVSLGSNVKEKSDIFLLSNTLSTRTILSLGGFKFIPEMPKDMDTWQNKYENTLHYTESPSGTIIVDRQILPLLYAVINDFKNGEKLNAFKNDEVSKYIKQILESEPFWNFNNDVDKVHVLAADPNVKTIEPYKIDVRSAFKLPEYGNYCAVLLYSTAKDE